MAKLRENSKIPLKKLDGFETLTPQGIKHILIFCQQVVESSYNLFGQKQNTQFRIRDFSQNIFLLRKIGAITNYNEAIEEPNLLISDIVSFVEQIRTDLYRNKNVKLSTTQKNELNKIVSLFDLLGVSIDSDKIRVTDIERIENNLGSTISRVTDFISQVLKTTKLATEEEIGELTELKTEAEKEKILKTAFGGTSSSKSSDPETEGEGNDQEDLKKEKELKTPQKDLPQKFSKDFNLAQLDPESRRYLQYLSIITINQTLNRYFDDATLKKLDLVEIPTFDQLPIDLRQQLMTSSFTQVEALLIGGKYNIQDLINKPSTRINLANNASINLLMDINTINIINKTVRKIAKKDISSKEKKEITQEQKEEIKKFEKEVTEAKKKGDLTKDEGQRILQNFKTSLSTITEDQFIEELAQIAKKSGRDPTGADVLSRSNILPTIDTFIQEGIPVEYLNNFDYGKFIFYFGKDVINEKTFKKYEVEIKNLFVSYWKSRRSQLASIGREEIAFERIGVEEAEALWEEINASKNGLDEHFEMMQYHRRLNFYYGGETITGVLAGQKTDDPILQLYQEAQQSSHLAKLKKEFDNYLRTSSQSSHQQITVYYQFYFQQPAPEILTMSDFQNIQSRFNPYDSYALNANQDLGVNAFQHNQGGTSQFRQQYKGQGGLRAALENSPIGEAGDMLAKEALKYGLRAGIGAATGGTSEAAFQAWNAAKKALPLLEQIEDKFLNKILKFLKEYGPYLLTAAILMSLIPLAGLLLIPAGIFFALKNGGLGLFGKQGISAGAGTGTNSIFQRNFNQGVSGKATIANSQAATSKATTAQAAKGLGNSAMATASQAVIGTVVITIGATFFYRVNLENAFLTDFPLIDPLANTLTNKKSKYAEIEKNSKIISGCPNTENNGQKCENPNFPTTITYEIIFKGKKDYNIQITNIEDIVKFRQSESAWEELEKRVPPTIKESKTFTLKDFKEIKNNEDLFLEPGETLVLNYEIKNLDANYNHTAIINTIEVNFNYSNSFESGSDTVKTATRICLGDCSAGAGCWPTTGVISQLPGGDFSHADADAIDIASLKIPNIYAPFAGELCFVGCDEDGYGCNVNLSFDGEILKFAHFEKGAIKIKMNSCINVEEGYLIGPMGNNGYSFGPHLHYEAAIDGVFDDLRSGILYNLNSTIINLVPETDAGNYPPVLRDYVTTCYE